MEHMAALQRTVAELREHCPWTRALDHQALAGYLTEEAEEVSEEIRAGSMGDPLRKELGDVLLQVVLHAQLAAERGEFTLDDVAEAMYSKLVRRSPHVYRPDGTLDLAGRVSRRSRLPGSASKLKRNRKKENSHVPHRQRLWARDPRFPREPHGGG
ncbi:hypothetical protein [Nesterenkonia pannonica]|uniref:MazG nucleotide pyrophosphohydrolase domain-containing protein n=1 Tax=Nesterenkonia pannonica TaxID=1548602 RepID=UPI00216496C5|nr:MazG nucleotide pyrophosphohydrolase domain-containing protein [Nesterenkonia pannonica]